MLILALDTTTRAGSVGVARDGAVLAVVGGDATRTHAERLPEEIAAALHRAGVDRDALDLLVVASGPGAFTGLRIGLAAMQGLAMVLGTPIVAVPALDALAEAAWRELDVPGEQAVVAMMDAHRGEVFMGAYVLDAAPDAGAGAEEPVGSGGPQVGRPEELLRLTASLIPGPATFVGDGARRHAGAVLEHGAGRWRVAEAVPLLAPALARLGRRRAARGEAGPPHAVQPLYIRRPDAERDRDRAAGP